MAPEVTGDKKRPGHAPIGSANREAINAGIRVGKGVEGYLRRLGASQHAGTPEDLAKAEDHVTKLVDQIRASTIVKSLPLRAKLADAVEKRDRLRGGIPDDMAEWEQRFTEVALDYAQRKGFADDAWQVYRSAGVPAELLRASGIDENRGRPLAWYQVDNDGPSADDVEDQDDADDG